MLPGAMAFYSLDGTMAQRLAALAGQLQRTGRFAGSRTPAITWLRHPWPDGVSPQASGALGPAVVRGACWGGDQPCDPAGLVRLAYAIAVEEWLRSDRLLEEPELRRALAAMLRSGSHDATAHLLDRLSGVSGGPSLLPPLRPAWERQRRLVDDWLQSLGWSELQGCSARHRTWQEGLYGRERDFLGPGGENGNTFCSDGLARLLHGVISGTLVSPPACGRLAELLRLDRSAVPLAMEANRLASALPAGMRLRGLADHSRRAAGLALHAEPAVRCPGGGEATLLVVLAPGQSREASARMLLDLALQLLLD